MNAMSKFEYFGSSVCDARKSEYFDKDEDDPWLRFPEDKKYYIMWTNMYSVFFISIFMRFYILIMRSILYFSIWLLYVFTFSS